MRNEHRCQRHRWSWDAGVPYKGLLTVLSRGRLWAAARIVAVADVYSALREPRAYKPLLSHADAFNVMIHGDEKLRPQYLDPEIMRVVMAASFQISTAYSRLPVGDSGPSSSTN